ncbi:MAG: hypothetical protein RIR91_1292 [Verrucomicrobiota bacterium]|jgi:hypothetical protein
MELSLRRVPITRSHLGPELSQANLQGLPISMVDGKSRENVVLSGGVLKTRITALIEIHEMHACSLQRAGVRQSSQLKVQRLGTSLE